jgi:hypothetical protein
MNLKKKLQKNETQKYKCPKKSIESKLSTNDAVES